MVLFGASPSCWQSFTNNLSSNGGDSFRGWQQYVASLTSNKKRLSARRRQTFMVVVMHIKKSVAKWCRKICLTQSWHHQYLLKNLNIWTVHHYLFGLKDLTSWTSKNDFANFFVFAKIFDHEVWKLWSRRRWRQRHRGHSFANIFAKTTNFAKPLCLFIWGPGGVFFTKKVSDISWHCPFNSCPQIVIHAVKINLGLLSPHQLFFNLGIPKC